jgi:hypothetical protein
MKSKSTCPKWQDASEARVSESGGSTTTTTTTMPHWRRAEIPFAVGAAGCLATMTSRAATEAATDFSGPIRHSKTTMWSASVSAAALFQARRQLWA